MQISAEIRWFWQNLPPPRLQDWFCNADVNGPVAGGGKKRVDEYLIDPGQVELGIKRRDGKKGAEVKGLVQVLLDGLAVPPFTGPIELWTKWTSEPLDLRPYATISTVKRRWLRKFDTVGSIPQEIALDADEKPLGGERLPDLGCNVELTEVTLPGGSVWWTAGFEAFGSLETVRGSLTSVAKTLSARQPPELEHGRLLSYPSWLKEVNPTPRA